MEMFKLGVLLLLFTVVCGLHVPQRYQPTWQSLDARPLPDWYDKAKIGIFVHWGIFSVPAFNIEWFWWWWKKDPRPEFTDFMAKNYKPSFTYQDFAKDFTVEMFNATWWAELFHYAGARYVVLTSKHHEGYTLWPSKYAYSWNSKDVGPNRDLVGELGTAVRKFNMKYGLYHSLMEWFHPVFMEEEASKWKTNDFALKKIIPEMKELVEGYKPEIVWSDGDGQAPDTYWNSTEFIAWLYNDSPVKDTVIVNDRWGSNTACKHGGVYTCRDRYNPGTLQTHKWENAMTIDRFSWGYSRTALLKDYMTTLELLTEIASTVACGGNVLINVGATKDGRIMPIFEERLREMGDWLFINGEGIYNTKPWTHQNDSITSNVWYTTNFGQVYAIVLFWPQGHTLKLGSIAPLFQKPGAKINILGSQNEIGDLNVTVSPNYVTVHFPDDITRVKSKLAYVLKIYNIPN